MRINGFVMVFLLLLCVKNTSAQRFGAGVVAGFNMSQIAGDEMAGFDKFGFVGGLHGTANLVDKLDLNVEFLYSVRGSRPGVFNPSVDPDINITLKYLDLPVYVTYKDWYDEVKGYHKAYLLGGFSYGRLLNVTTSDNHHDGDDDLDALVEFFNDNDFSWMLGFGFRLHKRFEIQFRYTSSITLLLDAEKHELNTFSLRPFFITIRGEYIF